MGLWNRNHVLDAGGDSPWKGAILGVVEPTEKHWESLLQHMQQRLSFSSQ